VITEFWSVANLLEGLKIFGSILGVFTILFLLGIWLLEGSKDDAW